MVCRDSSTSGDFIKFIFIIIQMSLLLTTILTVGSLMTYRAFALTESGPLFLKISRHLY